MASPRPGSINDRGVGGNVYTDKRQVFKGAGWVEPQGSVSCFEDFITAHVDSASNVGRVGNVHVGQSGTPLTVATMDAAAGPVPVGHGGWLLGKTDDVDGEIDSLTLGKAAAWLSPTMAGNGMCVAEVGFVIPTALTTRGYFFGFTDVVHTGTGDGALAITTGTTLVAGNSSADSVGFVYSSEATDVDGFYMGAVKATVVGTAVLCDSSIGGNLSTVAVDNYIKLRVEVDADGDVFFFGDEDTAATAINRKMDVQFQGSQAAAITAATLQGVNFSARTTTTTGVEWEVDYLFGACSG